MVKVFRIDKCLNKSYIIFSNLEIHHVLKKKIRLNKTSPSQENSQKPIKLSSMHNTYYKRGMNSSFCVFSLSPKGNLQPIFFCVKMSQEKFTRKSLSYLYISLLYFIQFNTVSLNFYTY